MTPNYKWYLEYNFMKIALLSLKIVHLRSRWGTVTNVSAQGGELLFIMALLGQAVQTHQTGQVPPQISRGTDIQLDFDGH